LNAVAVDAYDRGAWTASAEARTMQFLFGDCVFDSEARRLTRAGHAVPLAPKPLALLERLLSRCPAVVPQQELRDLLWPRTFVGYNNLGQVVAELRRALGDHGQRLVRTAYGAGYAFDGEVVAADRSARTPDGPAGCCLRWGSLEIPLRAGANVVGRAPGCECRIPSRHVSREHARITVSGRRAQLDDLGSKNGTHVQGRRVAGPTVLADGDLILLGQEAVVFSTVGAWDTTESYGVSGTAAGASARVAVARRRRR
jgi:DNA-binding winged helix-turn-helix (wHTH) protein